MANGAIDMARYIGAFNDEYAGSYSGLWANQISNIYTGLQSLTTRIPGLNPPSGPSLYDSNVGRRKQRPQDFEVDLVSEQYEDNTVYPVANFKLDNLGIYENNVRELARKAAFHFNQLAADLIIDNPTCSDGVDLFSTQHPYTVYTGGSSSTHKQKNLITASEYPNLNVVLVSSPTDIEMAKIIADMFAHLISLKDASGDTVNGDCRSVSVITGDALKWSAIQQAISKIVLSDRSDNPVSGFKNKIEFIPVLEPSLTGDSIFMARNDGIVKGIILGEVEAEPLALGPDSEYAKYNLEVFFGYDAIRGSAPGRYQSMVEGVLS